MHCKFLLAMVYACRHPPAEGFDDKRLPDKRQVLAERYAARCVALRCGTVRVGMLADYAFG